MSTMSATLRRTLKSGDSGGSRYGLPGRLLEVAVCVGMDEETGLIHRPTEPSPEGVDDLFTSNYEPHLLDIVSGAQQVNNIALMNLNGTNAYNPQDWRKNLRRVSQHQNKKGSQQGGARRVKSIRRLRQRANRDEQVPLSTDFLENLPLMCLPDESRVHQVEPDTQINYLVLTELSGSRHYATTMTTYRPYWAYKPPDSKMYRLVSMKQMKPHITSDTPLEEQWRQVYVPHVICFISESPYFDVLRTCLSCLHKEASVLTKSLRDEPEVNRKILQKYVTNMSIILCPPPAISLNIGLNGLPIRLHSSDDSAQPNFISDFDLEVSLRVFNHQLDNLFQILAYILMEQSVVFISTNRSLITLTIEALLSHIRPFIWAHQYVPTVFNELVDLVGCPGIFIFGCHSMHKEEIIENGNAQIVVDLDEGTIIPCNNGNADVFDSSNDNFGSIPINVKQKTKSKLEEITSQRRKRLEGRMSKLAIVNVEDMKRVEMEDRDESNSCIQDIFLEFMVNLFGDTLSHLDHEMHQFQREKFLDDIVPQNDLPFYTKVTKTYMFSRFIQDRLNLKDDKFYKLSKFAERREKKVPIRLKPGRNQPRAANKVKSMQILSQFDGSISPHLNGGSNGRKHHKKMKRNLSYNSCISPATSASGNSSFFISEPSSLQKISNELPFDKLKTTVKSITMPIFPKQGTNFDAVHFYKRCIELISTILTQMNDHTNGDVIIHNNDVTIHDTTVDEGRMRAALLILRGNYYIACGNYELGLQDLHATAKEDVSMVPESTIKKIVTSLTDKERQLMRSKTFYLGDDYYDGNSKKNSTSMYQRSGTDLPHTSVDKNKFSYILEKSDISSDSEIINLLFDVLSGGNIKIDPEIFAAFYQTWKQSRHECEVASRSIIQQCRNNIGLLQDNHEDILKISPVVWSNCQSNGRIVITNRKILFFTDGYQECKSMIRLGEINEIKVGKHKNFFRTKQTIVVKNSHEKIMKAAVGSEADLWKVFINELKIAKTISKSVKDYSMSLVNAAQNITIADALYQVAKDEEDFMTMEEAKKTINKFCKYTTLQANGQLQAVPMDTYEMLAHHIDSSPKESKKTGVDNILFSSSANGGSRIWLALQSSKIRALDTTNWTLDTRSIRDCNGKLTSMLMANPQELWVGSTDRNIYVIRVDQMKKIRVLHEHLTSVVCIVHCSGRIVSASSDGIFKVWKEGVNKSERSFNIQLSKYSSTTKKSDNELISVNTLLSRYLCCCTHYSIHLLTIEGLQLQRLTVGEFFTDPISISDTKITTCTCTQDGQIWCGNSSGEVYVWYKRKKILSLTEDVSVNEDLKYTPRSTILLFGMDLKLSITTMLPSGKFMWIGDSEGDVIMVDIETISKERTLKGHNANVTCLCAVENRYIVSGSASKDGKLKVWRSTYRE